MNQFKFICLYFLLYSVSYCSPIEPKITTKTITDSIEVQRALKSKNLKAMLMKHQKDDSSDLGRYLFAAASDSCVAMVVAWVEGITDGVPINMRNQLQSRNDVSNSIGRMIWPPKPEQIRPPNPPTWQIITKVFGLMCHSLTNNPSHELVPGVSDDLVPGVSDGEGDEGYVADEDGVTSYPLEVDENEDHN